MDLGISSSAGLGSPLRILYVINSIAIGGAEQTVLALVKGLDRDRFQPSVCLLWRGEPVRGPSFLRRLREEHIDTHMIRMRGNLDLTCIPRLVCLMRQGQVGIVHTFLLVAQFYGRAAAKLARVPVIITSEQGQHSKSRQPIKAVEVQLSKITDAVLPCSNALRRFLCERVGVPAHKVITVHNSIPVSSYTESHDGVLMREALGLDKAGLTIGMVAHLRPEKGHTFFLQAAAQVLEEIPDVSFLLVGEGLLKDNLQSLARELGISSAVHFLGSRQDIPRILSAIDVFVLSSLWEGFGIAVAEAMAMKKPVVATAVGGIPEVVADGETGILVPPRDSDALASAIVRLLRDEPLRKAMGEAGRRRVEDYFSSQAMVKRFEEIYDRLWQRKRPR